MTSYRDAGVDLEGADRHVEAIAPLVTATWGDGVIGGFGGFAAGVTIPAGYTDPVLMLTTDGVGTKLELAARTGRWDGVGYDLVAMCVDDLAAAGAEPLAFVDYMAIGALDPVRDTAVVASIARACAEAGAALVGGETAEHPGVMRPDQIDLAGTAMGVVERASVPDPTRIRPGNVVIGLPSPNLRSNGFSLVRSVFADDSLDAPLEGSDEPLGAVLLSPSVIYSPTVLAAFATGAVEGAAHITGGGLPGNLPRTLPEGCGASLDPRTWERQPLHAEMHRRGVSADDLAATFNLGIGFCLVAAADRAEEVLASATGARVVGTVVDGSGVVFEGPFI